MKQVGTFRVKVSSSFDRKKLKSGVTKDYTYGSISMRSPKLTEFIGKILMIRIFVGENKGSELILKKKDKVKA